MFLYQYTYADLRNRAGNFKAGAGPGSFSFVYTGPNAVAKAVVKAGPNQFGGVMRLLGTQQARAAVLFVPGYHYTYRSNWLFDLVGESGMGTTYGTFRRLTFSVGRYHSPGYFAVKATAFPWTTGTASVWVSRGGSPIRFQQRQGYDNRTAQGKGTIQLVSPLLTHWLHGEPDLLSFDFDTAAIGILRIALPEPDQWMMLVAGLGFLGVLSRARTR